MSSKVTKIILVRHGQTVWNLEGRQQGQLDSPLTQLGLSQADGLAERLSAEGASAIYSSDLNRAYQTAKRIGTKADLEVFVDERLRERNFGILQGLTKQEMEKGHPKEYSLFRTSGPDYIIPEGESAKQFFRRCIDCLEQIAHKHRSEKIIVVTHLGVLSCVLRHTLGIPLHVPRRFKALAGSLNLLEVKHGKWVLETWGATSPFSRLNSGASK